MIRATAIHIDGHASSVDCITIGEALKYIKGMAIDYVTDNPVIRGFAGYDNPAHVVEYAVRYAPESDMPTLHEYAEFTDVEHEEVSGELL